MDAIVVGGGVIGLTTAIRLVNRGWHVRVVASAFGPRTTSGVAGAIWYPYGVSGDRALAWARRSHAVFLAQAGQTPGVELRGGWELFRAPEQLPKWGPIVGGVTRVEPCRLPAAYADGHEFTTPIIDMSAYLSWLTGVARSLGASIEQRFLGSLADVSNATDLIVNCSGLGAAQLAGDSSIVPVRGQVVRVENPGLRRFVRDDGNPAGRTYIYPRGDDCVLGGTSEWGDSRLAPDAATTARILRACRAIEPRLAHAAVIEVLVGLRPWRPEVRLEVDRTWPGPSILVHNYGHGGAGVTLSWGCAEEVLRLVDGCCQGGRAN